MQRSKVYLVPLAKVMGDGGKETVKHVHDCLHAHTHKNSYSQPCPTPHKTNPARSPLPGWLLETLGDLFINGRPRRCRPSPLGASQVVGADRGRDVISRSFSDNLADRLRVMRSGNVAMIWGKGGRFGNAAPRELGRGKRGNAAAPGE